jgi:hypothetical protein
LVRLKPDTTHMREISSWLKRIVFILLLSASIGSTAAAQPAESDLDSTLTPGTTAWITDVSGREVKTRIVTVSGSVVTASAHGELRRFETTDIKRIEVRQSDSLLDGALIGAGAAIAFGLVVCTAMEPWENCRDDVGPMLRAGAVGAGIGIGIDALIRGRRTVYEGAPRPVGVHAAPILSRYEKGFRVSVSF